MKISNKSQAGFTLGEAIVAIGMAMVVATAATSMTLNGTILFAKNTAENISHDQNRIAVSRLVRDIHAAVSAPQLGKIVPGNLAANPTAPAGSWTPSGTNVTFWAESGSGPSAGISFKKMGRAGDPYGGPFEVRNDPGNTDLIQIDSGQSHAPTPGMEIIFPYYGMEGTLTKVTSNGANHWNVWIAGGLETRIKKKKDTSVICYYMSRFAYVVENGNLNLYSSSPPPTGVTWPVTVARNIVQTPDKNNYTEVKLFDNSYSPANVTVKRGEGVMWNWITDKNREVVCPGQFDSGKHKDGGYKFYYTFTQTGTFKYNHDNSFFGYVTVVPSDSVNVKPFTQTDPDYVTINLTTEDNRYSNRNYKAVNTLLAGSVPIRSKISKTQ